MIKDSSLKELSKEKAFDHSTDQINTGFKAIDKKKIIFKRGKLCNFQLINFILDEISKDAYLEEINQQKYGFKIHY